MTTKIYTCTGKNLHIDCAGGTSVSVSLEEANSLKKRLQGEDSDDMSISSYDGFSILLSPDAADSFTIGKDYILTLSECEAAVAG